MITPDMTPWSYPNSQTPILMNTETLYSSGLPVSLLPVLPCTSGMEGSCGIVVGSEGRRLSLSRAEEKGGGVRGRRPFEREKGANVSDLCEHAVLHTGARSAKPVVSSCARC